MNTTVTKINPTKHSTNQYSEQFSTVNTSAQIRTPYANSNLHRRYRNWQLSSLFWRSSLILASSYQVA